MRSFWPGQHWLPGFLSAGPCSFMAKLLDSRVVRHHRNHIRQKALQIEEPQPITASADDDLLEIGGNGETATTAVRAQAPEEQPPRYPTGDQRALDRYDPF